MVSLSGTGASAGAFTGDDELPEGLKVGKYRVQRLIGRGGMGAVYQAMDTVLQREVALKVLPKALTENEQALKRFVREAQSAARLNHPNVVTVYDVGRKGQVYYIAMELVRGIGCDELLKRDGKLAPAEATRLAVETCKALAAAHTAGLIHRDIKPANILRDGQGAIKVGDFGLAKLTAAGDATLTQKDMIVGTPKYMSPEQANNEAVDARSDLYSLGATYYALLTGAAPYEDGSTMQILFAHCAKPVPDPRLLDKTLPEACTAVIQKSMAKKAEDRYQSAEAMLEALEAVGRVGAASGASAAPVTAAALEQAADDGGSMAEALSLLDAPAAADDEPVQATGLGTVPDRRGGPPWLLIGGIAAAVVLVGGVVAAVLVALLLSGGGRNQLRSPPVAEATIASSMEALDELPSDASALPDLDGSGESLKEVLGLTNPTTPPVGSEPVMAQADDPGPAAASPEPGKPIEVAATSPTTDDPARAAIADWMKQSLSPDEPTEPALVEQPEQEPEPSQSNTPESPDPTEAVTPEPSDPEPNASEPDKVQQRYDRLMRDVERAKETNNKTRLRTAVRSLHLFHRQYVNADDPHHRELAQDVKRTLDNIRSSAPSGGDSRTAPPPPDERPPRR